ncbi:MAG: iron-sulfur cluster assembly scaffold protein [Mesorhizobium sp.]|uniref:iron-sulfur cluster assembly scaffold protein n=1 Tax=unclassified Mesorhizobium TaxID=325217 RepID=UPI000F7619A2|nr:MULTISPECIES: iron-sulfur cluster assembly scaffold protein [unclassified Mesorhizobium]RVC81689.1 iron-sulfur cluster assembly scaffold protein [Mesorhizobium sp. M2A.F.Ca.ET.046.02.1.1]AZO34139.1 iron-sulfur cluster assembly scaffold protein [Mesorhizobium sp. M2A.F.Ca.ET.046.03.2.1]AZO71567.1 iron-sulfur cluster assembly scaffold protein [Mesorhizobium sp. M1D.F.Ca.ET.043.01.1.1]RWB49856.1 MAG: iron-sulfur cluster assembly scaffold protein [Mesorhizobium sp.]RWD00905.1 MAG: iron-sulfur c
MRDDTDNVYLISDKVYFINPNNVGALDIPKAAGNVGAVAYGDGLKLTMAFDRKTQTIFAATFQTFGRGSDITASSPLAEFIVGKTIDEVLQITDEHIADFLGAMPHTTYSALDRLILERGLRLMSEFFRAVRQAFEETPGFSRLVLVKGSSP